MFRIETACIMYIENRGTELSSYLSNNKQLRQQSWRSPESNSDRQGSTTYNYESEIHLFVT